MFDRMLGRTSDNSWCVLVSGPAASDNSDNNNFTENGDKIMFDESDNIRAYIASKKQKKRNCKS